MSSQSEQWYRDHASGHVGGEEIQVDSDAIVSTNDNDGAWVQAWVWVPDPK